MTPPAITAFCITSKTAPSPLSMFRGPSQAPPLHSASTMQARSSANTTTPAAMVTGPNPPPPAGTTADMILCHDADGLYEIYDIGGNAFLAANFLGQVGTDFQVAGLGRFFGSDTTDMLLRNATTGLFEVYDIANATI